MIYFIIWKERKEYPLKKEICEMQKDGVYCKQENGKVVESMQTLQSTVQLNNGIEMPIFGLGVYKSERDTVPAVQAAIKNGYRLIDTAAF